MNLIIPKIGRFRPNIVSYERKICTCSEKKQNANGIKWIFHMTLKAAIFQFYCPAFVPDHVVNQEERHFASVHMDPKRVDFDL